MAVSGVTDDLLWRVEEACGNAYPAARELRLDGWLLRASGGRTRRINSVNPVRFGPTDPSPIIDETLALYARVGQTGLFRVPTLVPAMDAPLARRGFAAEGETLTLTTDDIAGEIPENVTLVERPEPAWFTSWEACRPDADAATITGHRRTVSNLLIPAIFACRHIDREPVAVAYAALHRGIAVLESVATHPAYRQSGHARAVITAIMAWAHSSGAEAFCLQVVADNVPARALYRKVGFHRELYRYHYRWAPHAA